MDPDYEKTNAELLAEDLELGRSTGAIKEDDEALVADFLEEMKEANEKQNGPSLPPELQIIGSLQIDVRANGEWELKNILNDLPLNKKAIHDLLIGIADAYNIEVITENVFAKLQRKLSGGNN